MFGLSNFFTVPATTTTPIATTTITLTTTAKNTGVTILTFRGHVTSSVMWPFDSWWSTSYEWSTVTTRLSGTVMEIRRLKVHVHKQTYIHTGGQNDQSL